jgi:3'(2'), 5'-bisphosphate nucleotidase
MQAGATVAWKGDGSPVTAADHAANAYILAKLAECAPGIPVVTEESDWHGVREADIARQFIIVDPLDGTREFIARNGEFTVNLALIREGAPVAGAVYIPVLSRLYTGATRARVVQFGTDSAPEREITGRPYPPDGLTATVSRSHIDSETDAFLDGFHVASRVACGSSLKFCRIAEGWADVYPRFGRTMEWDIAAGHAVLQAAGGQVLQPDGSPVRYGKMRDGFCNGPFIAWGRERLT